MPCGMVRMCSSPQKCNADLSCNTHTQLKFCPHKNTHASHIQNGVAVVSPHMTQHTHPLSPLMISYSILTNSSLTIGIGTHTHTHTHTHTTHTHTHENSKCRDQLIFFLRVYFSRFLFPSHSCSLSLCPTYTDRQSVR